MTGLTGSPPSADGGRLVDPMLPDVARLVVVLRRCTGARFAGAGASVSTRGFCSVAPAAEALVLESARAPRVEAAPRAALGGIFVALQKGGARVDGRWRKVSCGTAGPSGCV